MDKLYIKRVLNGEVDAFRYFVKQYKDKAYNISVSILKNEFEAKDAVQEAFIIAFRKLSSFKAKSDFSAWFFRILVNESLKALKKQKNVNFASVEDMDGLPNEIAENGSTIEELDQQIFFIEKAIERVPPKEALVITLFYLEESSINEISNLTGWSKSHIKVLLFRGRKSLYSELHKLLKSEAKQLY